MPAHKDKSRDCRRGAIGAWLAFAALFGIVLGVIQAWDGSKAPRAITVSAVERQQAAIVVRVIAPILN